MATPGQVIYFSHGGGPLPLLSDTSHAAMVEFMSGLSQRLRRPDHILVISAHWEESVATLLGAKQPSMFYDYYGFPPESYQLQYPALGDTTLAARALELLQEAGIPASINEERGYDHGLYAPLLMTYPEADIPSTQLSLLRGLDPQAHLELGKALRPLLQENVLIIGSGFSFHNMRAFRFEGGREPDAENDAFQNWLIEACTDASEESKRFQRLLYWEDAPGARYCHPREEHLLPLHVCVGLAGNNPAEIVFDDYILGKRALAFLWQ